MSPKSPGGQRLLAGIWVLLLALLLALRYREYTFRSEPLLDERVYVAAGRAVLAGHSPFDGEYLYLPAFAWLLAKVFALFGEDSCLAALRAANILAAACFVWLGAAKSGFGPYGRCLFAGAYLWLAPAVYSSISTGNPTFLVGLMIFLGLEIAGRRPWAGGALLGASLLVKPLAPGAIAWLAGSRSSRAGTQERALGGALGKALGAAWGLRAAVVAAAFLAGGLLPLELAPEFFHQRPPGASLEHNPAVYRLLEWAGLPLRPLFYTAAICLIGWALSVRSRRPPAELYLWALPSMFLASPLVWNHTLCLSFPLQAAALGLAFKRRRPLEQVAVVLGMLLLAFWHGIHALPPDAIAARWIFTAAPALTPFFLAAYCLLLAKPAPACDPNSRL